MALKIFSAINRKKTNYEKEASSLARVLTKMDLVLLGVGGTLGLGAYVLAGQVAKNVAGPAVCLSFLIAAIASAVGGICYAEFAARVPRAGSSYIYSYVSVGEGVAFLIGWNFILGGMLSLASTARGLTAYIDTLDNNLIRDTLSEWFPMNVTFLSAYVDCVSFAFIFVLTGLFSVGVKESSFSQNLFSLLNLTTLCVGIVAASLKVNVHNWNIQTSEIDEEYKADAGTGGFMPFGIAGVLAGAPRCFYGFAGFDAPSSCSEEAKNPKRAIPLAIIFSLVIVFFVYSIMAIVLTMAWPYYLQSEDAALAHVFDELGWTAVKWVVTVGAIFALCSVLLACMYPLPRIIYAMAKDGLIFRCFGYVNPRTKTPLIATITSGLLASIIAAVLNLNDLIDMISFGGLVSYVIISISVVTLRYTDSNVQGSESEATNEKEVRQKECFNILLDIFNINCCKKPNRKSSLIVKWSIVLYSILNFILGGTLFYGTSFLSHNYYLVAVITISMIMVITVVVIARQPQAETILSFKVPLVPYVPCMSIFLNTSLILQLSPKTWLFSMVWMTIGFLVYAFYGMRNSEETEDRRKQRAINTPIEVTQL